MPTKSDGARTMVSPDPSTGPHPPLMCGDATGPHRPGPDEQTATRRGGRSTSAGELPMKAGQEAAMRVMRATVAVAVMAAACGGRGGDSDGGPGGADAAGGPAGCPTRSGRMGTLVV